jgi:redox-sensitive bicupin YhaK (pirin superfamily)
MTERGLETVVTPIAASDGAGVRLKRSIATRTLDHLDPFFLFDHFGSENANDYIAGFPMHPHRGIETITYVLAGSVEHGDSLGNKGKMTAGDVQWMTAGSGIVHSEMPEQTSGLMRGFQLWVNLPARLKMTDPAYQEHGAEHMPVEERAGGARVKVIAGETSLGTRGPISAEATQPIYFDVELAEGGEFIEAVPSDRAAFVVVHNGRLEVDGRTIDAVGLAELGAGDTVVLRASGGPARALLIAGKPLNEPVAWHGPFVMNTYAELVQAVEDYQAGRF